MASSAPDALMPIAQINGTAIYHEVTGQGPPLALLNGIMMSTASWGLQLPALAPAYRCILHDFRGQLRSGLEPPVTMEQHAEDLAALLDVLEIRAPVHLVGTSYGGEVAMEFAIRYPELARSLTLIACVARPDPELLAKVEAGRRAALEDPAALYDISVADFFSREFVAANGGLIAARREAVRALPAAFFRGYAALCESFAKLDVLARLPEIGCPLLVIAAAEDRLKPVRFSRQIAGAVRGGELRILENAGHAVVIERADEVNGLVLKFLEQLT